MESPLKPSDARLNLKVSINGIRTSAYELYYTWVNAIFGSSFIENNWVPIGHVGPVLMMGTDGDENLHPFLPRWAYSAYQISTPQRLKISGMLRPMWSVVLGRGDERFTCPDPAFLRSTSIPVVASEPDAIALLSKLPVVAKWKHRISVAKDKGILAHLGGGELETAGRYFKANGKFPIVDLSGVLVDTVVDEIPVDLRNEFFACAFLKNAKGDLCVAIESPVASFRDKLRSRHSIVVEERNLFLCPFVCQPTPKEGGVGVDFVSQASAYTPERTSVQEYIFDDDLKIDLLKATEGKVIFKGVVGHAVVADAADVHLDPTESGGLVRLNIHGQRKAFLKLDKGSFQMLAGYIRSLANLHERCHLEPRDARITIGFRNSNIDLRIATMPIDDSPQPSFTLRLVGREMQFQSLETTGIDPRTLRVLRRALREPYGIILVSGATGAGKTTTIHAGLQEIIEFAGVTKNIISCEDPVEIRHSGVNQTKVDLQQGMSYTTFAKGALRMAPNVIFIGEIRDPETAAIAVETARTGHLVIATVHAKGAVDVAGRLDGLGIHRNDYLDAMLLILHQHLVLKPCMSCSEEIPIESIPDVEMFRRRWHLHMGSEPLPQTVLRANPTGCSLCSGGHSGRVAIGEVLPISDEMVEAMREERGGYVKSAAEIESIARREVGFQSMFQDALSRIARHELAYNALDGVSNRFWVKEVL